MKFIAITLGGIWMEAENLFIYNLEFESRIGGKILPYLRRIIRSRNFALTTFLTD